ncbi:DUF885 domain-containing protein [Xanthomonas albilineans]|uniref:DUF885 domain-containing protein n=1 Tax=Xanthomonas albilineans TaxID=29447 RepID=UPI0005F35FC5|nr:DUF885 family protein [Xanthomonas albilineans]
MPSSFPRLLPLAIAAALSLSLATPADATKKKTAKQQATQTKGKTSKTHKARAVPHAPVAVALTKAQRLNRLYDDYWEASLKQNPLQATFQGDSRYNDQLPNFLSAAFRQQSHDFTLEWLNKAEAIGKDGLSGQDLLSYEIFVSDARNALEAEKYPSWMQPVNQFYNVGSIMAMLGSGAGAQPFHTIKDYDNWSRRALGIPTLFNQAIANMREGMQAGVVQPRALMEKVLPQLDAVIKPTAEESLFWGPVRNLPADIPEAEKQRITAEYKRMIEYRIMPAYRALRGFIATQYLPATRVSAGIGALPNGEAWYAHDVRQSTTTDLTPAQIHQIGLDEVARIQGQIQTVMKQVRFRGSMQKFFKFMQNDKRFTFNSEDELLNDYRNLQSRVNAAMPPMFTLMPKARLEIRPMEPNRAQSTTGSSYMPPSEDGHQPGIFYVNTSDLPNRKTWDAESRYLHEAIPGHHLQLGLQQELTNLPKFRRFGGETAFIEGWGMYAESLGKELNLYQDPYNYFGYLHNDLWRAIRLVVDTGLHSLGWTREQAITYMLDNSATSRTDAEAETERYMALPGQALSYKIGEMKILQLRDNASTQLGPRFDIRQFHAELVKDGTMPLNVLQGKIERWVASKKN